ncbi:probable ATP-dependent RNA helicase DDX27 [Tribolium castaneum]|uniref:RNA helicase n=1 Tax=Tribolium castaneum TaxID=7070 RepID=D6WQX5_TRICA|nr:PREDICTED: probable ATP-dependent RNA helicase DDX27 [Tribolium castaneum]EFA06493.1 putative ATP-dependent RNA helicase DDX27-like Protein [Tribolium castaneum]|eukprot:XP_008195091.1 PREDICTED: probable ATP-dependent RNA helicase DDX27 [Tribolium castaneum]
MGEAKKPQFVDLIRTIGDDDEIEDFSEESDAEVEFQPTKQKNKRKVDFDTDFQFVSSAEEYNKDSWNDLTKYVKRKAKTKTDDKIKKVLVEAPHADSDVSLSDSELKHDKIREKETRKKAAPNENFFETVDLDTEHASFYQMNLSRPLLKAISDMKFVHPTPIQASTIPVALMGRDICGCAATGTGKTAAYMLPTLERLLYRPVGGPPVTRVLVLVPTRELGVQVYQVTKQLAQFSDIQIGLAVGGLDLKAQETILRKNPDIVIATPGRLIDHLKSTPTFGLDSIEVLILDEADRMLDEYFAEQMKEIIKQCARTRQTMLFSATMTEEVESLAAVSLNKPVRLFVDSNREVAFGLRQEFVRIRQDKEGDREAILAALVCRTFREHCMVFVQTKKQAHRLHILLGLLGLKVGELHGNLTQPQRLDALQKFKETQIDVLVATDVAARGLDIQGVQTVINFVMPATVEHYIHRVGRTARAGRAGVSVSLAGEQERKIVKDVVKKAKHPVKSRVIPPDILEKYKNKLEKLEPQIAQILQEEYEERQVAKVENQVNKVEKLLKGEKGEARPWFQTKKQRKDEKKRLSLKDVPKNKSDKDKRKHKKGAKETPDERVRSEMGKVALLQAKLAKKKQKLTKINAVVDVEVGRKAGVKRKKTNFGSDLWDTKSAKKLRHEANAAKKGKVFGKPQQKKKRR